MVYKEITVDVWKKPHEEIRVIQEEAEGRILAVHVLDAAKPLDLSQKSVFFYIQKADDKLIYAPVQVEGNTVKIILTGQMMSAYGRTKLCELEVVGDKGQVLKITLPVLYIVKSAYHDAIESTSEFSALTESLQKIETLTEKAESAAQTAENASKSAEQAVRKAEELDQNVTSAETERVQAEELRCENEKLRETAEDSRGAAFSQWQELSGTALEMVTSAMAEANQAAERANQAAEGIESLEIEHVISEIIAEEKGKNGGIAALDQDGKISPMPTASDVGAREASWVPTAVETGAVPVTEKGKANGVATLNGQGKLVQMPTASDVGAREASWVPTAVETGAVPIAEKGKANGVATLNEQGKLVQMPTASDVGAREASWVPTAVETGAVPITEKGEANGVATLNGQGKLVQMPSAEDVGARSNNWLPTASETGAAPNLLINSSFVINQRGKESYTRASGQHIYTVDRWMAYGCVSVAREANTSPAMTAYQLKIGLANPGQSTFLQPIEDFELLVGKTVSLSFWLKADAVEQINVYFGLGANLITATTSWQEFKVTVPTVQSGAFVSKGLCFQTVSNTPTATYYQLAAPQAVLGSSTDQYHKPDPSLEMLRCRRYFYSLNSSKSKYGLIGLGYARWSDLTLVGVPVTLAIPMRTESPAVEMTGTIGTMGLPSVINAVSVESYYSTENIIRLRFKMSGQLEANTYYELAARNDADANVTLDAEIYD